MSMSKSNFLAPRQSILIFCITQAFSLSFPPPSLFLSVSATLSPLYIFAAHSENIFVFARFQEQQKSHTKKTPNQTKHWKKNCAATWGMFEIPRKSMQRGTFFLFFFFWLDICVALGRGRGKQGQWLQGIWQSQRQHAANGRRKLYAKTMTKHTRQTERRRDRHTWKTAETETGEENESRRREGKRKRCQQYAYNAKPQIKFHFFQFYVLYFLQLFKTSLTNSWVCLNMCVCMCLCVCQCVFQLLQSRIKRISNRFICSYI